MHFDKTMLEQGLKNALVRAYIMRDFVLPLKGYTLKELVGNQSTRLPIIYKDNEKYLQAIDQGKEIETFPVEGPIMGQENLISFHLYEDRPFQEIVGLTTMEAARIYSALSEIAMQEDSGLIRFLLIFSFGFSIEEVCETSTSMVISRKTYSANDNPLPITALSSFTPAVIQIGLLNYMTKKETPSMQVIGLLADPNIDPKEKNEKLLNEFHVDINRSMNEDYEYLSRLESDSED